MTQNDRLVGLDVSKDWLDCHVLPGGEAWRVRNDAAGHAALIERLAALGVRCAVLEASGGYEKAAVSALRAAGLKVRVVDPKRVRYFAKALGLAKNDRIDAQVIARFGQATADDRDTTILPDARREALSELLGVRQDLLEHRTALSQQARGLSVDTAQVLPDHWRPASRLLSNSTARSPRPSPRTRRSPSWRAASTACPAWGRWRSPP